MSEIEGAVERLVQRVWTIEHLRNAAPADSDVLLRQAQELTGLTYRQFDLATGRMRISDNFEAVLGYKPVQSIAEVVSQVHPVDRERFLAWCVNQFTKVCRTSLTFRIQPRSGVVRWVETHGETLPDDAGRPRTVLLTSRDVSRHRFSDVEVAAHTDQLRRVQAAVRVGTWETDFETGSEKWSPEAWALVEPGGIGEATLERWIAAVHPDDREEAWRRTEEAMTTGHHDSEYRVVHPDGSVRWLRAVATVEKNEAGHATLMRGVVTDVTEARQAKDALSRLAEIIEATPYYVGWSDLDGRVVYLNPAAKAMLGGGPNDTIKDLWAPELLASGHRGRIEEMRKALATDGIWRGEVELTARDGRTIPVAATRILHRDAAGKPVYTSTVCRDISKGKAAEAALREADRRKDVFLATLAHELRNPLAPLRTVGEILRQLEVDDPRIGPAQRIVEQQTSHLTRLVDDLLDVSRISNGKLALKKANCSIVEAVKAAVETCRSDTDARGHRVDVVLPPEVLAATVEGDMFRLTQVFMNLVGNAAKYTPGGGHIVVSARLEGQAVRIAVEDNGVGIAAGFLPNVFDAFAQAEEQRAKAAGGLGLGLMLVKQIVELHGGTIAASSPGPGKGARLEVRLPLAAGQVVIAPVSGDGEAATLKGVGTKVLVVDDYPAIRDSMELMLSMRGFVVATAARGDDALRKVLTFKPGAALIDARMPGMSGMDVARALRANAETSGLRLIAMSGNGTAQDREMALQAGFDEHVVKPVPIDRLVELLTAPALGKRAVA